ncbi:RNA polymerase subunit sigma-24 [Rhodococcus sp. 852002-51564_SCH6189132-a]|uniref:RNA polymerase sigma factor n=1 Tax=Rhodococcus sp. 852002-51564_SCH6189132-a TaxID=1834103 RepID=UPI0007EB0C13|nr:RNA polymerase sigma factor [Rhodococcus sp. 852002-51564_SCH6189132-a]OBA35236.1 RNA polymerase subunit sigma-24 [Rhodococcus sp. 852002-51564_SCH6189132-a]
MSLPDHLPRASLPPFEEVVTRHGATVLRVCRALLGPVDADDAWSETFLAALRAYPDLPPGSKIEAWLVTIAHRKAVDIHRVRGRTPVPTENLPEPASATGNPGEGDDELWSAVAELPFTQRAALVYHYVGGLPYAEIGTILGNSPAAARRAAADGRVALRRRIEHGTGCRS